MTMTSRAEHRHPEAEQRCSWCHAAPGDACTNQRNEPRAQPHPGRRDTWVVAHTDCPACQAPAGTACIADTGKPVARVHPDRAQAATDAYTEALEAASRDVKGPRR